MEITIAAFKALCAQRAEYTARINDLEEEIAHYLERYGHTNSDWAKAKRDRLQAELSGFVEAARIMGIDLRK